MTDDEKLSRQQVIRRRDDALLRALTTPPKPKQETVKPEGPKVKKEKAAK